MSSDFDEGCQVNAIVAAQRVSLREMSGVSAKGFRHLHGDVLRPVVLERPLGLALGRRAAMTGERFICRYAPNHFRGSCERQKG